eukprot:293072_1
MSFDFNKIKEMNTSTIHCVSGFIREANSLLASSQYVTVPKLITNLSLCYYDSSDKWDNESIESIAAQSKYCQMQIAENKSSIQLNKHCKGTACLSTIINSHKYRWKFAVKKIALMHNFTCFDLGIFKIKNEEQINHNWKCANCGKEENLWFNLGDGYVGCG